MMLGDSKHRELLFLFLEVRDWGSKTGRRMNESAGGDISYAGSANETQDVLSQFKLALS